MVRGIKLFCVVLPSLAALVCSSAAFAATLQSIKGSVLINHGAGYQPVAEPIAPKVGDLVMANVGGSAQVVYSAQCSVAVTPGKVVTIAVEAPCRKTADVDFESTRMNDGAPRPCGDKGFCAPPEEERNWVGLVPMAAIGILAGLCGTETGICSASGD
jgi:hypothetical protein